MNWSRYIDNYCERMDPGFWAEPLNAVSNGAFIMAAIAAAVLIMGSDTARRDGAVWFLAVLVAVIGTGSFLFHTFATFWAMLADVIPISIFIYVYLGYALRRYVGAGWLPTLVLVIVFAAGSFWLDGAVPADVLNGSVGYLPALGALVLLGGLLLRKGHPAGRGLLAAAVLFTVSLTFRSIDNTVCEALPMGTHFVWHCLNALLLFSLLRTAVRHGRGAG